MNEDRRILRELENLINESNTLEKELIEWNDKIAILDDGFNELKKEHSHSETFTPSIELEKENFENTKTSLIKEYFSLQKEIDELTIGIRYMNDINNKNQKLFDELQAVDLFLEFLDCQVEFSSFDLFDTQIKVKCNMGEYISTIKLEIAGYPTTVSIEQRTDRGLQEFGFNVKRMRLAEFISRLFLKD